MSNNVVSFKKPKAAVKHKGNTLCRRGFHKWKAVPGTPFDVRSGKLITRYQCERCGAERTEST